jgi:hypothetical protein
LLGGGLNTEDWVALLERGGALSAARAEGPGSQAGADLQKTLDELEQRTAPPGGAESAEPDGAELIEALRAINRQVDGLVAGARDRIRDLAQAVADEETDASPGGPWDSVPRRPTMSRRRLLTVLAEIVQEACQPLSVIQCSVELMSSRSLGDVTDTQVDMLRLASESAAKIRILIDDLRRIAGEPEALSPDKQIQSSLYSERTSRVEPAPRSPARSCDAAGG